MRGRRVALKASTRCRATLVSDRPLPASRRHGVRGPPLALPRRGWGCDGWAAGGRLSPPVAAPSPSLLGVVRFLLLTPRSAADYSPPVPLARAQRATW